MTEASGSLTSHYIISAIQKAGHLAYGSDVNAFNVASQICDGFIIMPYSDDEQLWEKTYAILEKHQIAIVLPTLDETLYQWSLRKEELQKRGVSVLISPPHTIQTFIDKWKTYEFFKSIDIPTPKTAIFHHFGILKPRFGRGGSGIEILSTSKGGGGNMNITLRRSKSLGRNTPLIAFLITKASPFISSQENASGCAMENPLTARCSMSKR